MGFTEEPSSGGALGATVSAQIVRLLLAGAGARGLDPFEIAAAHSVDPAVLGDLDARLPAGVVLALWEALRQKTALPHFGIWLAELALASPVATLAGHLIQSAPTLGEGFSRLLTFERVLNGVQASTLVLRDDVAVLEHRAPPGLGPGAVPAIEFAFAWMLGIARKTTGEHMIPRAVTFAHAVPASLAEYARFFGVTPSFGGGPRSCDALELQRDLLALPQITADEIVRELTERHARALLQRLPQSADLSSRVRACLVDRISRGHAPDLGLDALAGELKLPARTLQRRLAAESASYQQILDDARRTLALAHLEDPATSIAETAFALGFQDQSAFHRAFVRWTGETPGEHRRRVRER
jgi:AraC-like DNA-binding protein